MAHIPAIDSTTCNQPVYNAVKVKVNNPQTNVADELKESVNNGIYNAVSIEIDNPSVNLAKNSLYTYPQAKEIVTYDKACAPINYNLINNRTFINAEIDVKNCPPKTKQPQKTEKVPAPNLTTTEAEKKAPEIVAFHGLSFKASPELKVDKAVKMESAEDIGKVMDNLASDDYDVQSAQMEKIAKTALQDEKGALVYINSDVITALIDIIEKDTSGMKGPSLSQIESRKKIIINEIVKENMREQNKEVKDSELPYQISKEEIEDASVLSPLELAERNKEYGLYTLSALTKVYGQEYEKKMGHVVPLTDLPGAASFAESLSKGNNPGVKMAAIDSLMYIRRPEYNREIKALLKVAVNDKNPSVARLAQEAIELIDVLEK